MAIAYELWDLETRNIVAVFDSEETALAGVRQTLYLQGRESAETLFLGTNDEDGDGELIAQGADLVARAEAARPDGARNGLPTPSTTATARSIRTR